MKRAACLLVVAVVLLIGCNSQDEGLVGRWVYGEESLELRADGRFVSTLVDRTVAGTWTAADGQLCAAHDEVVDECIGYVLDGDRLIIEMPVGDADETVEMVFRREE